MTQTRCFRLFVSKEAALYGISSTHCIVLYSPLHRSSLQWHFVMPSVVLHPTLLSTPQLSTTFVTPWTQYNHSITTVTRTANMSWHVCSYWTYTGNNNNLGRRERDLLPVPADVHSTAKGKRGLISKQVSTITRNEDMKDIAKCGKILKQSRDHNHALLLVICHPVA